ncbi:MAG: MFS transporter, partial [Clostridia bacterium]|nr:MFS transporter [Clostridia bacterium]
FLYGLGLAGMASVQSNIFPDVTDVDELITGERREGTIATFSSFVKKFVNGFASLGVGLLLTAFGFDTQASASQQTAVALRGLRIAYSAAPLVFFALAIVMICRYRMTRADHAMLKRAIAEKRETGRADLSPAEIRTLEALSGHRFSEMWIGSGEPAEAMHC